MSEIPVTEKQERTIKVGPIAISDESLDSILEMAGYGIGYWATSATVDKEARTYTVHDAEDDETHVLSFDKLHRVFWNIASGEKRQCNSEIQSYFRSAVLDGASEGEGDIDAGHIDSDAADVLIQVAAFGSIVYG
jgi:hypothetical protein